MLTAVDGALVRIDLERSDLGATMSRMEHTIANLSNVVGTQRPLGLASKMRTLQKRQQK